MGRINDTTVKPTAANYPRLAGASPPLKVCITSRAPFVGGAELAAERLALGLREQGHDVFFIVGKRGEVMQRYEDAGFACHYFPIQFTDKRRWFRYLASRHTLRNLFKRQRPNIVHSNDLPSSQVYHDAARGLGVTRICLHRFLYDGKAIDWFNKYGAERHLFVSGALMNELCSRSAKLAASNCAVVYDGLPLPVAPSLEDRLAARAELGLSTDLRRPIVTFAGQIIERKGVCDLLQAWACLSETKGDRAELVIVGDDLAGKGAYRAQMEQLAQLLNISPRFVGFAKNVARWLTASDIAVVPSHVEPLGNATLEAMAHGLPVIGSRVGGIPEMIDDNETGLLVPSRTPAALADALDALISDADRRRQLGAQGRRRCEQRFSLKAHADAVLAEYATARGERELRRAA